jgi:hypothetical protein
MGRPGSGRARNASISFPRSATISFQSVISGRASAREPGISIRNLRIPGSCCARPGMTDAQ